MLISHFKSARFLFKHKWYVFAECFKHGIIWRGLVHDMSKFLPNEWFAYARYFHEGMKNKAEFDAAHQRHRSKNKHHWQYWTTTHEDGTVEPRPIPEPYLTEMICDWVGSGKAQGRLSPPNDRYWEIRDFWLTKGKFFNIHEDTKKEIEARLFGGKKW